MAKHNNTGKWGEELACETYRSKGYTVIERNWRSGHYEIDIIAIKDSRIIFAEVKARSENSVDPLKAIDSRKIARLARAADAYIQSHGIKQDAQFDVFSITGTPDNYKIEHIEDAIFPPLRTYR